MPNNSKKMQLEYDYKIFDLVRKIGIDNFTSYWKFFKEAKTEEIKNQLRERY